MVLRKIIVIKSHCKIEHLLLVQYIQKKNSLQLLKLFTFMFFGLFLSELIVVKIDHVSVLPNYNRNSIWVRPTVSILAGCVKQRET